MVKWNYYDIQTGIYFRNLDVCTPLSQHWQEAVVKQRKL